ncbi:MAG: EAL domain-containing protein, partial [Butyrivibrio sp.]|nr:EAL domain-containing protein [Butyrivibrio sp.]
MTHKEKANELLRQKYHCSQALFGAFADDFGLDSRLAFKLSTCFGAGLRMGEICGCVTASMMILGLAFGFYDAQDRELEMYGNQKTREFMERFKEKMGGSNLCRDILQQDFATKDGQEVIKQAGLVLKKCPKPLEASIDIIEEMLAEYETELADNQKILEEYQKEELDFMQQAAGISNKWNEAEIVEHDKMREVLKRMTKQSRFQKNIGDLIYSSVRRIAFIQFDIRGFKVINDLYGEHFGDEILYFITDKLGEICNENQYFVNLRSDVFMIVTEYSSQEELEIFIHKVDDAISNFKDTELSFVYGVYTVEDRDMELRQMEDRAAMARKAAKKNLVSNILFYKEQFKELLYTRKFIEESMKSAIAERQFQMYLQPKYSIAKNSIVGAEALVRWLHPQRGMIYPNEFIPVIEENGFIRQVDYYIWEEAAKFIRRCEDTGIEDCPISVNVSRIHLQDNECQKVLEEIIARTKITRRLLELEITETVNDQQISQKALDLKEEGFKLLMDDFGSGYSSLNILLETPFDVLKLDKKFIENMMVSDRGKLILEQIVTMAEKLGLGLLAEGVET